jgi:uncharacterized protein (TIGR00369 family)
VTSHLIETLAELRASGDVSRIAERIPYAQFMGIGFELIDGELRGRMRYSDMLVGNPALPALHGGTISALLETTAIFQLVWERETLVLPKTVSITVDFLRSGRPEDTWAHAIVTKLGRRVANVRAIAWQSDRAKPITIANAHFLIDSSDD